MIGERSTVALTEDLADRGLKRGDLGTVVLVHPEQGYEVEFMTLTGEHLAVVSLFPSQIREIGAREIAQARLLETVS